MGKKLKKCQASGKVMYREHADAMSAAEYLMAIDYRRDFRLFVYRCPSCHQFHLTKVPQAAGPRPEKLTEGKDVR